MFKNDFEFLNGMHWTIGAFDFDIPFVGKSEKSIFFFNQNLPVITWNWLKILEQNSSTLPQTRTILNGKSVEGLDVNDLLQVKNYGDGAKELVRLLRAGEFSIDIETASALHRYVGYKDALEWGTLRNLNTGIHDVEYVPPSFEKLPMLAKDGFDFLTSEVRDPKEQAIAVFLFMARTQIFFDANKRTASLMMNGTMAVGTETRIFSTIGMMMTVLMTMTIVLTKETTSGTTVIPAVPITFGVGMMERIILTKAMMNGMTTMMIRA